MTGVITEKECKTKYVYVEMIINKKDKHDVVAGLFKGMYKHKDGTEFILLHGLKDSTNMLNIDLYNVLSIEELSDGYRNMAYFTIEKSEKKKSLEKVDKLYKSMLEAGLNIDNDKKIIDINKYRDVPKEYVQGKPLDGGITTGGGTYNQSHCGYSRTGASDDYSVNNTSKKDPEPTVIKRTSGKKPSKSDLKLMEEKINKIMENEYEPKLPETKGKCLDDDDDDDYLKDQTHFSGMGQGYHC